MSGSLTTQDLSQSGHLSVAKGHFGAAYVHTIAAGAGYGVQVAGGAKDAAGIDLTILARPAGSTRRAHELHLQVKCTTRGLRDNEVVIDLPLKNYDELRDDGVLTPLVLVVVVVPDDPTAWITQTDEALIARRCAWWINLTGAAPAPGSTTVRVKLRRSDVFSPDALQGMMARIAKGERP